MATAKQAIAREQIRRGNRRLGPKPASSTPVPFAGGLDPNRLIGIDCPVCHATAVLPMPVRLTDEPTPQYLMRCKEAAVRAHHLNRPRCPGDGLQIQMTL